MNQTQLEVERERSPHLDNSRLTHLLTVLTHLLPLLYIPLALAIIPIDQVFSLDDDEGINLMKSFLYHDGYQLYREIWSDQPPLFTVLLAQGWRLFRISPATDPGSAVVFARLLVLTFATGLLWCLGQVVRRTVGAIGAIATLLILINSRYFIKLSVSVMIGLPAIALALLSLYCLWFPSKRRNKLWIWASGIAFGLSLQTKLFTIFLLPLLGLTLMLPSFRRWNGSFLSPSTVRQRLTNLGLWLTSLGLTYLSIGLCFQSLQWGQLLEPHAVSRQANLFQSSSFFSITYLLSNTFGFDYIFWGLGGFGLVTLVRQRASSRHTLHPWFPVLWLITATLLLAQHRPVWYHHGLLLSIPLAWLGGNAVQRACHSSRLYRGGVGLLLVAAVVLETLHFLPEHNHYYEKVRDNLSSWALVQQLNSTPEPTRWVLTDRPIFAFYAGLKVPPPLAVPSMKRFQMGGLDHEALLEIVSTYQPEQILFPNAAKDSQFRRALDTSKALQQYVQLHYQRNQPLPKPEASHWVSSRVAKTTP